MTAEGDDPGAAVVAAFVRLTGASGATPRGTGPVPLPPGSPFRGLRERGAPADLLASLWHLADALDARARAAGAPSPATVDTMCAYFVALASAIRWGRREATWSEDEGPGAALRRGVARAARRAAETLTAEAVAAAMDPPEGAFHQLRLFGAPPGLLVTLGDLGSVLHTLARAAEEPDAGPQAIISAGLDVVLVFAVAVRQAADWVAGPGSPGPRGPGGVPPGGDGPRLAPTPGGVVVPLKGRAS